MILIALMACYSTSSVLAHRLRTLANSDGSAFGIANTDGAGLHIGAPLVATPTDPDFESGEGVGGETIWESRRF